jgi:hypothetical protein
LIELFAELTDDDDDEETDVVELEFDDSGKMLFSIRLVEFVNAFRLFVLLLLVVVPDDGLAFRRDVPFEAARPFMQLVADEHAAAAAADTFNCVFVVLASTVPFSCGCDCKMPLLFELDVIVRLDDVPLSKFVVFELVFGTG